MLGWVRSSSVASVLCLACGPDDPSGDPGGSSDANASTSDASSTVNIVTSADGTGDPPPPPDGSDTMLPVDPDTSTGAPPPASTGPDPGSTSSGGTSDGSAGQESDGGSSSGGDVSSSSSTTDAATTGVVGGCGDDMVGPGEQCDGDRLQGFTCQSLGLDGGELACDPVTCTFDTSMCTSNPGGTGG